MASIDQNTKLPLSIVAVVLSTVVSCTVWVTAVSAKADNLHDKVQKLESLVEELPELKARLASMEYKLDFLVTVARSGGEIAKRKHP